MDDFDSYVEKKLDEVMPWIGLYITTASAVCTVAMAADAVIGFRHKRLWFPCKYFSLNALSLTLLAIAMKLTQDIGTNLPRNSDTKLAKVTSLAFMPTAMANFLPSLGSMNNKELVANMVAVGILVITILANGLIEYIQLRWRYVESVSWIPPTSMLLLLPALVASAISVPTIKRDLELKYQEKHRVALIADEVVQRRETVRIDKRKQEMMKYWVMAETSTPQFVMARSVVCTTLALIPLLPNILLLIGIILVMVEDIKWLLRTTSVYGGYTHWILAIQAIGVMVGLIAPTSRWFVVVGFKCATTNQYSFRKEFKIERHWIQTLVDWRDSFSGQHKCTRYLHDAKWILLTFCIGVQILIVVFSKLLVLLSALLKRSIFLLFTRTKKSMIWRLFSKVSTSNNRAGNDESDDNLTSYVLLLDGEAELPRWILKGICRRADNMIQLGRKKQTKSLVNLLHRFDNFNGVGQYDTIQIPSLHSQEPPNCWTLPVVTLASIAIALPHIAKHKKERLVSSVSEGLSIAKIVDKALDKNAQLVNIRKAADVCWVGVALYKKWLDMDLRKTSLKCKNSEEVLRELSKKSEKSVQEFKRETMDPLMENPHNWPVKVVAGNSMYRISRTILLSFEMENEQTDERLFERLSVMIADIMAACLTNLAHVITTMCHHNAIEKREESVHEAFLLLGKTEQVLQLLQQHEWPSLGHDKAAYIDEWRAFFWQNQDHPEASTSGNEIASTPASNEESLAITVGS